MTIKNPTATATSSHCSTLSSTVTDFDTSTGVASTGTTVEEGQQVNPSFTHSVRTQEEELVETETPVDSYTSIYAQGPVDVPNGWEVHREVDQTIIRIRSFNAIEFGHKLCVGVVWNVCVVLFFVATKLWWFLLIPFAREVDFAHSTSQLVAVSIPPTSPSTTIMWYGKIARSNSVHHGRRCDSPRVGTKRFACGEGRPVLTRRCASGTIFTFGMPGPNHSPSCHLRVPNWTKHCLWHKKSRST